MSAFECQVRVYYADTDAGGVVFHGNYLKYFDQARSELLGRGSIGQHAFREQRGIVFAVRALSVDYLNPSHLDDLLTIRSSVKQLGKVTMKFFQQVWREDTLLAEGDIKLACVDIRRRRVVAVPEDVRAYLESVVARQSM